MKNCRICFVKLQLGENWLESNKKVYNYMCQGCSNKINSRNFKLWAENNPDKAKEKHKVWVKENTNKMKEYSKEWRAKNPESKRLSNKKYGKIWRLENQEAKKKSNDNWKLNNPSKVKEDRIKRNVLLKNAVVTTASKEKMNQLYKLAKDLELLTGYKWHVDHIIPLSKGGKHHEDNMCVITEKDNLEKGDKIISWRIDYYGGDNILEL